MASNELMVKIQGLKNPELNAVCSSLYRDFEHTETVVNQTAYNVIEAVARIDREKLCAGEDYYKNAVDVLMGVFGIKKTVAYSYLKAAKNLVELDGHIFKEIRDGNWSLTALATIAHLGTDARQMIKEGTISDSMTVNVLKEKVAGIKGTKKGIAAKSGQPENTDPTDDTPAEETPSTVGMVQNVPDNGGRVQRIIHTAGCSDNWTGKNPHEWHDFFTQQGYKVDVRDMMLYAYDFDTGDCAVIEWEFYDGNLS